MSGEKNKNLLASVFGEFNYKAPLWAQKFNKKIFVFIVFLIIAMIAGAFAYKHLNSDLLLQAKVSLNENTYILDAKGETIAQKGSNLVINFDLDQNAKTKIAGAQVFSALELNNEIVKKGISASPDLGEGVWRWNGNSLIFSPANPWLPNKNYSIKLDKSLFNPLFKFKEKIEFSTPAFAAKIEKLEIYSPPLNPKDKAISAILVFNYPIAKQDLSSFINLKSKDENYANLHLNFEQNTFGNKVFISSSKLKFANKEAVLSLNVNSGIKTLDAQTPQLTKISKNLAIPSVYSFFRITNLQTKVVDDEEGNPKQNLLLEFTDAVDTDQIGSKIEAYILPKDRYWDKESVNSALQAGAQNGGKGANSEKVNGALELNKLARVDLRLNPVTNKYMKFVSFNFLYPHGGQMLVKIPVGLKSVSGFEMGIAENGVLSIENLPRKVDIQGKSWLALNNAYNGEDRRIVIKSFGVNRLETSLVKLNRKDLIQVLTQTNGDLSQLNFLNYSFNENDLGEHKKITTQVYQKTLSQPAYTSLNLSPYLALSNTGFFIVKAQGSLNNDWQTSSAKKLLVITNLGLIAKDNNDGTHKVYAHSLLTNDKVEGAKVRVLSRSGKEVFSTYTDAFGVADVANLSDLSGADQPAIYLVEKDGDLAFLPFKRWDRYLQFEDSPIYGFSDEHFKGLSAFVFSDRGIYRPGETVKIGVAVKNQDFKKIRPQFVRLKIRDENWNDILERKIKLDETGLFDFSFKTQANQITGNYTISVENTDYNSYKQLGEASFRLEEFSPATMKLATSIDLQKNAWLLPNDIKVDLDLKTLYGFAVANHKIDGNYVLEEMDFSFKQYPNFLFKNSVDKNTSLQSKKSEKLESVTTDKNGKANFEFSLDKLSTGLYALLVNSTTLDDTNTLSAKNLLLVSSLEKLLGYKSSVNLNKIKKDQPANLDLLLVDRKLNKITDENLQVKIYQKRKVSSLVKQENGNLAYQFIEEEKFTQSIKLSLAKSAKLNLPTQKSGDFVAKFENTNGALVLQLDFSVLKENGSSADTENLVVALDKTKYEVGETARISLNAPYSGLALITLEREKVLSHKWVQLQAGNQSVEFNLPSDLKGSAYINTLLVRSLAEQNTISEPLSYAVSEIYINPTRENLSVNLEVPKKIRAGDNLKISYTTAEKSKLILYAVDEGILQVAKYKTPKPLDFFFAKRALEVRTEQMADLLMPGLKIMLGMPSGAGSDEMFFAKTEALADSNFDQAKSLADSSLNPLLRQVKAPVAFWSGILNADKEKQQISIKLPQSFTGKLRIIAFAANDSALGVDAKNTLSIAPLILSSNAVNYMAKDDIAEFSISLRNGDLDEAKTGVELNLESNGLLEVVDFKNQKFNLAGGEEKLIKFKVNAKAVGVANLKFVAKYKDYKTQEVRSISVRPVTKYALQMNLGLSNAKEFELKPNAEVEKTLARSQIIVAKDVSPILYGLNSYLQNFEHDCTEQLVSKIYPLISLNKDYLLKNRFTLSGSNDFNKLEKVGETLNFNSDASTNSNSKNDQKQSADYLIKYNKLLDILLARKNYDGSFAYWSNGAKGSNLVSLYVINFLLDAKQAGLDIKNLDANNTNFLNQIVKENLDAFEVAYAIYLLARQNVNVYSLLSTYQEEQDKVSSNWHKNLNGAYIASAWKVLGNNEYADFIENYDWATKVYGDFGENESVKKVDRANKANSNADINRFYVVENAQFVYLMARHFPEQLEKLDAKKLELLLLPLAQGNLNSLTAGFTSVAFNNLPDRILSKAGVLEATTNKSGKFNLLINGKEAASDSAKILYEAKEYIPDSQVKNPNGAWLFYVHKTLGFAKDTETFAKGVEITKNFFDLDGNTKLEFEQGEELLVKIKLRSTDNLEHKNLVLTDMLPGGLSLSRENIEAKDLVDYFDLREDRINFYLSANGETKTLTYRAKAIASGEFKALPPQIESMYETQIKARGTESTIYIKAKK